LKNNFDKDKQYYKFCFYGLLKNQRFYEPFFILFFLEAGLNFLEIGILYSIREIITNVLEIPTGLVADAFGRKRSMVFSFVSYIISFVIFFFSTSYGIYLVAITFFSMADAFRTGTHKAMIFHYVQLKGWSKYKAHYYGHTRSCSQFGSAISSILAALIVIYHNEYKYVFLFATIPYFFDLLLMLTYPKELDGERKKIKLNEVGKLFVEHTKTFILSLKSISIWRSTANLAVYGGYYKAVKDYVQPIIATFALSIPIFVSFENKQRSAVLIGVIYSVIYLLTTIASRNSGRIADMFIKHQKPMNISLVIGFSAGVLSGIFYNLDIIWMVIFFFVFIFLIENIRKPIGLAFYTEILNKNIYATALSFEAQFKTLITAILAPIIGLVADEIGIGYSLIITSCIVLAFLPLIKLKK